MSRAAARTKAAVDDDGVAVVADVAVVIAVIAAVAPDRNRRGGISCSAERAARIPVWATGSLHCSGG